MPSTKIAFILQIFLRQTKHEEIKAILSETKSVQFVVTLLGATDIFRRQQILSQQAQKLDQLINDLFGNIKLQLDKLKMMQNLYATMLN